MLSIPSARFRQLQQQGADFFLTVIAVVHDITALLAMDRRQPRPSQN
jgi:hypothetical protein